SSSSTNVTRVLHGQPGWVWIEGWVKEGDIDGSLPGLSNVHVHVRLYRNGQFQRFVDVMTNAEGHYDSGYIEVGKGEWEVSTEFPGGGEWDPSETVPRKTFTVRDGVRLKALHSGKCMDVEGGHYADGTPVMHGTCLDPPAAHQNQVYEMRPFGSGASLEILARHSGMCLDVANASTADGARLVEHTCNGGANQRFHEAWGWGGEYAAYVADHSGKCLEVEGASQGWAAIQQWTCSGAQQQAFHPEPVEAGPIPTETSAAVVGKVDGAPGQVTVAGGVNPRAYAQGKAVTVNYQKEISGQWTTIEGNSQHPVLDANGNYQVTQGVGVGRWRTRAIFAGEGSLEGSASEYKEFTIQPGQCTTETFVTPSNAIGSQPGFITISGHVLVPNPECGVIDERWLNVNYYKQDASGNYVLDSTDHPVVHNGFYSEVNRPVGAGNWKVKTVFPGQDWFKESASSWPNAPGFSIVPNGWHIDNLGGTFTADPDISSQGPGRLDVFGRGAENSLWINSFPVKGTWGGWVPMGGALASGPGSVSWSSGRIDVVMVDGSSTISHWYWTGSSWAADNLGGTITADPDISSWGTNRLDVFARGVEGGLWHKWWGGAGWSAWEAMGGSLAGGPSAVSWGTNRIDVVARMTDNTIGHWYWNGGGWVYDNLGGTLTSDPAISSQGPGMLDVFARGTDNGLWHRWYTTGFGQWSNWEPMGGALTSGPGAVSWGQGRVDVVARGVNNSLEHWWFQN
ncbi:MAG TPA: RICIN domain-containing protein, partial [Solirubrobacterales bacterium]